MWSNHLVDRPSKRSCYHRLDLARRFSMLWPLNEMFKLIAKDLRWLD